MAAGQNILIIGGGVMGLACAWRLRQRGHAVQIFEARSITHQPDGHGQASAASAGMLAAALEAEAREENLLAFNLAAQHCWADFRAELEAATGQSIGYRNEGTLSLAFTRDDVAQLRHQQQLYARLGVECVWLTPDALREKEPNLNPATSAALYFAQDHQVDNRLLVQALHQAARAAGVEIHAHTPVTGLILEQNRVCGIKTAQAEFRADAVVLAAGAWSRDVPGLPENSRPPVRPVKGQMCALRMAPEQPLLRHVLWTPRSYLVPRADGTLLIGATVEEADFDPTLTAGVLLALLEGAWRALPGIEDLPLQESWVGFRPGARDDAPILGGGPLAGLVYACGHYRNGILQTPLTAEIIARYIDTGTLDARAQPFTLARIASATGKAA